MISLPRLSLSIKLKFNYTHLRLLKIYSHKRHYNQYNTEISASCQPRIYRHLSTGAECVFVQKA